MSFRCLAEFLATLCNFSLFHFCLCLKLSHWIDFEVYTYFILINFVAAIQIIFLIVFRSSWSILGFPSLLCSIYQHFSWWKTLKIFFKQCSKDSMFQIKYMNVLNVISIIAHSLVLVLNILIILMILSTLFSYFK